MTSGAAPNTPPNRLFASPQVIHATLDEFDIGRAVRLHELVAVYKAVRALQESIRARGSIRSDLQLFVLQRSLQIESGLQYIVESRPDTTERHSKAPDAILANLATGSRFAVEVTQWVMDRRYLKDFAAHVELKGMMAQHLTGLPAGGWEIVISRGAIPPKRHLEEWCREVAVAVISNAARLRPGEGTRIAAGVGLGFGEQRPETYVAFHFERPSRGPRSTKREPIPLLDQFRALLVEAVAKFQVTPYPGVLLVQMTADFNDLIALRDSLMQMRSEFHQVCRLSIIPSLGSFELLDIWKPGK